MEPSYIPFLCGAGLVISIVPLSILLYWVSKKGWFTLRLIAFVVFLLISSIGVLFWFYERNKEMLFLMLGLGVLAGLVVLSLRIISPKLVRLFNLKW
jgi:hypothetical protein